MKRKIGFFGLMKSFESAQTSFEKMSGGGIKATIHHDVMKNVKVKHLRWWFENIDGTTTFNGQDFDGLEAVSYTHLTLPTKRMCRSRWSPYH